MKINKDKPTFNEMYPEEHKAMLEMLKSCSKVADIINASGPKAHMECGGNTYWLKEYKGELWLVSSPDGFNSENYHFMNDLSEIGEFEFTELKSQLDSWLLNPVVIKGI